MTSVYQPIEVRDRVNTNCFFRRQRFSFSKDTEMTGVDLRGYGFINPFSEEHNLTSSRQIWFAYAEPVALSYSTTMTYSYILLAGSGAATVDVAGANILEEQLEQRFNQLVEQWREEISLTSSIHEIVLNSAYQKIIAIGPEALSLILKELEKEPDWWFWALTCLTGQDPVPEEMSGDLEAMAEIWISWGVENGYLKPR